MCSCSGEMLKLSNSLDASLSKGKWGADPPEYPVKPPITSYGLMVFHWDVPNNRPLFFLSQSRDSIAYALFLRGRYKLQNIERYFSLMSNEERERLKTYSFDELWADVCVDHTGKIFRTERDNAYSHWVKVNTPDPNTQKSQLDVWLETTVSIQPELPWGFPKGRLFRKEPYLNCAYREFEEETGIISSSGDCSAFSGNLRPSMLTFDREGLKETFYGSDDTLYRSVYYLTLMTRLFHPKKIFKEGLIRPYMISDEMSNYGWFTYKEAINLVDTRKKKLLEEAYGWIITRTNTRGLVSCKTLPAPRRRRYNQNFPKKVHERNFRTLRD